MRPGLSRSGERRPSSGPRRTFHRVLAQALAGVMAAGLLTAGGLLAAAPSAQAAPAEPHTATDVYLTNVANGGMISARPSPVAMVTPPKGNEDQQQVRLEKQSNGNHRITRGGLCLARTTTPDVAVTVMRACGPDTEFVFESMGGEKYRILTSDRSRMLQSERMDNNLFAQLTPASPDDYYAWYVTPIDPPRKTVTGPVGDLTFDQVTQLTTHNAFWNAEDVSLPGIPAQPHSVRQQLENGVRGLMLDVYNPYQGPGTWVCHGDCFLGNAPTVSILADVVDWMRTKNAQVDNTDDIVTIFLEDYTGSGRLEQDLNAVPGLRDLIFDPAKEGVRENGWPKVSQMVNSGKRLLIFSSENGRQYLGIGYQPEWTVENYWDMGMPGFEADWTCETRWGHIPLVQEEEKFRRLFVMNHFRKYPTAPTAANDNSKLANRAGRFCMPAARKKPNFLAVDQYKSGDPMAAVLEFQGFTYHADTPGYGGTPAVPGEGGTPVWKAPRLAVMPLGDSITLGVGSSTCAGGVGRERCEGYRKILRDRLEPHATELDFVGSQQAGSHVDSQHEGHSGWMIDGITENIDNWLVAAKPNVITLHIGTNDINRDHAVQDAPARLTRLVDRITTASPATVVLLATIVPNTNAGKQPLVDAYNAEIRRFVTRAQGEQRKVELVEMGAVVAADLPDNLHPNSAGYQKMADAFFKGLAAAFAKGWIVPQVTVTPGPGIPGPSGRQLGDYDVDIDGNARSDYLVMGPNGAVNAYRNDGDASWTNLPGFAKGSSNWSKEDVRFADIDGDGRADYLVLGVNGSVRMYHNRGNGQWTDRGLIASGSSRWTKEDVRFADYDGDGRAEYLVLGSNGATSAYRYAGTGSSWTSLGQVANGSSQWTKEDVRFADYNGDGRADYLVLGVNGAMTAYRNDLNKQWTSLGQVANGSSQWTKEDVRFADYNGDGRADYLVLGVNGAMTAYRNDLNNQWTSLGQVANGSSNWTKADVRV
ncbi:FG-GAP-like repeat-containing protein [Streptomyces sp. NPDC020875]|uniref:FG-GAP-like repeat-containing protein n=1 Tax=Streptomyces sp. NPDC020875 TaxID=3154898 RepID=UPI0033D87F3A